MSPAISSLCQHLAKIGTLQQAAGLLSWDQETYMPRGAAEGRAEQLATLSEYAHDLLISSTTETLLEAAAKEVSSLDPDSDESRMVAVARRDYQQSAKLPSSLVRDLSLETSLAHERWVEARATANFSHFAASLERILELTRQMAEALGYAEHPYDALIDIYEPGMTSAKIDSLFSELKPELISLTQAISKQSRVDTSVLHRSYPIEIQKVLTVDVIEALGFDMTRGRQDTAVHPFCTNFGRDDVRLTTRYDPHFLPMSLYGSMHEAGHGLYEQGSPTKFEHTPLSGGVSLGVHESQSRLFENMVGRSLPFTEWLFPKLQKAYPEALDSVDLSDYYSAINTVRPSAIRVEADEVTYNLHILLRYELEQQLIAGSLRVTDLPDAWNAKMEEYFGLIPANEAEGVLQDTHWSIGSIGYFPTYTLGNILSGQLLEAVNLAYPTLESAIRQGDFTLLLDWLREHIHQYGRKFQPDELTKMATGKALETGPYLTYLRQKFSQIYEL